MIAGSNGSGKSTLTAWVDLEGHALLVDPDAIARTMNPSDTQSVVSAAGREALRRIDEYLSRRESL